MYVYHLGHSKAASPIALTQGMNNISIYPTTTSTSSLLLLLLHLHQEADFLPLFFFHMNLIGGL